MRGVIQGMQRAARPPLHSLSPARARLAYEAYGKAQGLDGRAASVRPKLKLLRELLAPVTGTK